jgi:hypothetical protein
LETHQCYVFLWNTYWIKVLFFIFQGNIDVAFSIHDRHNLIKHDYYSKENLERFMQDEEFTFI